MEKKLILRPINLSEIDFKDANGAIAKKKTISIRDESGLNITHIIEEQIVFTKEDMKEAYYSGFEDAHIDSKLRSFEEWFESNY
jgi:hypothetical protein